MPTYYHLFNTVDPGLIQHMARGKMALTLNFPPHILIVFLAGNGCNGHNEAEAEAAPWTVADSLALLTLMVVPVAAAPILCVGVVPLIPVSGKSSHSRC